MNLQQIYQKFLNDNPKKKSALKGNLFYYLNKAEKEDLSPEELYKNLSEITEKPALFELSPENRQKYKRQKEEARKLEKITGTKQKNFMQQDAEEHFKNIIGAWMPEKFNMEEYKIPSYSSSVPTILDKDYDEEEDKNLSNLFSQKWIEKGGDFSYKDGKPVLNFTGTAEDMKRMKNILHNSFVPETFLNYIKSEDKELTGKDRDKFLGLNIGELSKEEKKILSHYIKELYDEGIIGFNPQKEGYGAGHELTREKSWGDHAKDVLKAGLDSLTSLLGRYSYAPSEIEVYGNEANKDPELLQKGNLLRAGWLYEQGLGYDYLLNKHPEKLVEFFGKEEAEKILKDPKILLQPEYEQILDQIGSIEKEKQSLSRKAYNYIGDKIGFDTEEDIGSRDWTGKRDVKSTFIENLGGFLPFSNVLQKGKKLSNVLALMGGALGSSLSEGKTTGDAVTDLVGGIVGGALAGPAGLKLNKVIENFKNKDYRLQKKETKELYKTLQKMKNPDQQGEVIKKLVENDKITDTQADQLKLIFKVDEPLAFQKEYEKILKKNFENIKNYTKDVIGEHINKKEVLDNSFQEILDNYKEKTIKDILDNYKDKFILEKTFLPEGYKINKNFEKEDYRKIAKLLEENNIEKTPSFYKELLEDISNQKNLRQKAFEEKKANLIDAVLPTEKFHNNIQNIIEKNFTLDEPSLNLINKFTSRLNNEKIDAKDLLNLRREIKKTAKINTNRNPQLSFALNDLASEFDKTLSELRQSGSKNASDILDILSEYSKSSENINKTKELLQRLVPESEIKNIVNSLRFGPDKKISDLFFTENLPLEVLEKNIKNLPDSLLPVLESKAPKLARDIVLSKIKQNFDTEKMNKVYNFLGDKTNKEAVDIIKKEGFLNDILERAQQNKRFEMQDFSPEVSSQILKDFLLEKPSAKETKEILSKLNFSNPEQKEKFLNEINSFTKNMELLDTTSFLKDFENKNYDKILQKYNLPDIQKIVEKEINPEMSNYIQKNLRKRIKDELQGAFTDYTNSGNEENFKNHLSKIGELQKRMPKFFAEDAELQQLTQLVNENKKMEAELTEKLTEYAKKIQDFTPEQKKEIEKTLENLRKGQAEIPFKNDAIIGALFSLLSGNLSGLGITGAKTLGEIFLKRARQKSGTVLNLAQKLNFLQKEQQIKQKYSKMILEDLLENSLIGALPPVIKLEKDLQK